ncbi:MAG: hypothetical protein ACD_13C00014G0005 [uncultured bacterium]|nr:MAG: hypothetical protein ACD_13C00014G0005 [uncultured bacterium]KKR53113.1 MAG: hypothetical protein UT88_C0014G0010 [Candidatus Woesebacteria bacterium GW2011_GWD2_40_19]HAU65057.1 hypothetical protein [Candidatus Woesebacteria bacterium]HCC08746.1 hypothetical protein [Candidatus Woesebacteria bacterium]
MNLKDFLINKDSHPELFWALVIEEGLVQSGIWYIGDTTAEVVSIGAGIPWESEEELIEATDAALSSAIQKLPEDYPEPQKTVFGVSTSWVKEGEISPENLGKIKKLCAELSLTPVGFVVLPEAIAHLYKSEEGAPLNAIVLKSSGDNLELSVFKLGSLVGTTEVSRSVSLVDDVVEGLSRFDGVAPLPTRFIVYDGKEGDLEETKQILIQASWGEGKINFLHTPQVEILSMDGKVLATALAGGAEIGEVTAVVSGQDDEENELVEKESPEKGASEEPKPILAENLGFAVGADVSSMKKEDVQNIVSIETSGPVVPQPVPSQMTNIDKPNPMRIAGDYLSRSKNLFHSFSAKIFPKSISGSPSKNKTLVAVLAILGLLVLAVGILWWFVQTAKITIFVAPKRTEENVQISFSTDGQFDAAAGVLPAKVLTDQVSGEKTKSTTGTKLIGNKATGSVQIANGNGAAINLAAGTVLTSSSGFKFVTSSEASVSGQLLPGSPGTATVNISSVDIGSQYNLAKDEVFSVGNYSKALVAATSTGDFSGGSSQQISAVGQDDQTRLETDLKSELGQSVKSNLLAKITEEYIFITDLAVLETISENFDHKIGDPADSLKLSLSLSATGLAADRAKLLEYAKGVLAGKAPSGYTLSEDQINFKFTLAGGDTGGRYIYDVVVGGNFLPEVDKEKIKSVILGKTPTVAIDYLNSIPGFDHADVLLRIKFPDPLKTIPRIAKNISIDVKPE